MWRIVYRRAFDESRRARRPADTEPDRLGRKEEGRWGQSGSRRSITVERRKSSKEEDEEERIRLKAGDEEDEVFAEDFPPRS